MNLSFFAYEWYGETKLEILIKNQKLEEVDFKKVKQLVSDKYPEVLPGMISLKVVSDNRLFFTGFNQYLVSQNIEPLQFA
jgi:hypothetical protein